MPRPAPRPHRRTATARAQATAVAAPGSALPAWTFLTNYAHVLICLARDPALRMRDVATRVGITERAVQKIVAELSQAGFLAVEKDGRNNRYVINDRLAMRHPLEGHHAVKDLLLLAQ